MKLERKELPGFVAAAVLRRCRAEEVIVDLVDSKMTRDQAKQYLDDMAALYREIVEAGAEPTEEAMVAEWTRRKVAVKQQLETRSINSASMSAAESASGQVVTAELSPTVPQPEPELSDEQYETLGRLSRYMRTTGVLGFVFGFVGIFAGLARGGIDGAATTLSCLVSIAMALLTLNAAEPLREIPEVRRDVKRRLFAGMDALCNYYLAQILLFCVVLVVTVFAVLILAATSIGSRHY